MASNVFTNATKLFGDGDVDWLVDTIRVMLLTAAFVPDLDADIFVADVVADELVGAGYARITLAGKLSTKDNGNNRTDYIANNPRWRGIDTTSNITAQERLMAYLWFRTDMTDKPSSDRRTHPWCVQLESGERYLVSNVTGVTGAFTLTHGRQYGLLADHVLCFDGAVACLCDAKPVGH